MVPAMGRLFVALGAFSGLISVGAGAFGAHSLKKRLPEDLLAVFQTGAHYEMYHALALLAVGILLSRAPSQALTISGWLFVAGTLLFSGSLYALALTGVRGLGAVTPLGGLAFLAGWLALALWALRAKGAQ
jgi:uncharacterized membrane protein YgdD (TMEM256/DUF423 family)